MIQYAPVKMRHPIAGAAYGIIGQEHDEAGTVVRSIFVPDISCDYGYVSRLAARCTAGQLALSQLLDVIQDTLP